MYYGPLYSSVGNPMARPRVPTGFKGAHKITTLAAEQRPRLRRRVALVANVYFHFDLFAFGSSLLRLDPCRWMRRRAQKSFPEGQGGTWRLGLQ
jgi:predicted metal-dependent hydrolase